MAGPAGWRLRVGVSLVDVKDSWETMFHGNQILWQTMFHGFYRMIPVATETLNESEITAIGMVKMLVRRLPDIGWTPLSSLPITIQQGSARGVQKFLRGRSFRW